MHCGFCLPACPTYLLWGREADSPRGRIYLMKAERQERTAVTSSFRRHFDTCLGCMACVTACPSGVRYDRLIEATRPRIERRGSRGVGDRLFRELLFSVVTRPDRLRWLAGPLKLYQRSGLQRAARRTGALRVLPKRLAALEAIAPHVGAAERALPAVVPPEGPVRRRVGMLLGCVQRVFFSTTNWATARVLAAEGCEVRVPRAQGCCGALMLHAGREEQAAEAARDLIDGFAPLDRFDQIVVNAAGCGSAMKQYGDLLRNDPAYAPKARAFAARCVDVSELLAELEPRAPRHPLPLRVVYHDACHLQHAQGVRRQPRQLLEAIPGLELREVAEPDICCGSAGVYNLLEPDAGRALRDRKVKHLVAANADVVVSGNPGCLLQIASGLDSAVSAAGAPSSYDAPRTMHLVELVDASIRGVTIRPVRVPD